MPQAPTVAELVQQFQLKQHGRDRGRNELPPADSPRLDMPETEVVDHCRKRFTDQLAEYNKHRKVFEERMRTSDGAGASDADVEQVCLDVREAVEEERPELEGLAGRAQQAIGDLNQFKREEKLNRDADYPENRKIQVGVILGLLLVETLINGLFFGANLRTGTFGGVSYAVLISALNVIGLGLLAAVTYRLTKHRVPMQKMVGWVGLVIVALLAIAWNLLVGHYREALAVDYPPEPDTVQIVPEAAATEPGIEACWRGDDEADAGREALCLFIDSAFALGGFQSYMLWFIGLFAWLLGACEWYRNDDPYPGYGKRARKRRKAEKKLAHERAELLERLKEKQDEAQKRLLAAFTDPVDTRELALKAFDDLKRLHRDFRDFTKSLEASVRGALDIYRANNGQARSTPEPTVWQVPWAAGWIVPDAPDPSLVITEDEAASRSRAMRSDLEKRQARLRSCLEEQQKLVNDFTRLDPYDRAGPR